MSLSWISAQAWTHSAHACLSTARRPRAEEEGQDDTAEASDQGDSVLPPAVPKTKFSPSATMIFAGYVDGASKACQQFPNSPGVSAVRKTFGKAAGANSSRVVFSCTKSKRKCHFLLHPSDFPFVLPPERIVGHSV